MADIPNKQNTGDVTLFDEAGNPVQIVFDSVSGYYRLEVGAKIEGGSFQLTPFTPIINFVSDDSVSLNTSTWTTLANITSTSGKLDFIAVAGSSSNYRIRVTVDGNEIYDIAMFDLSALNLSNATNVPIWADTADKNFRYHPKQAVDFTDSLLIEAMATSATPTVNYIITHRESA